MVSQAARDLHTTAAADMLGSPSRYLWDAELLNSTLGWLVPSNMITIVGSRTFSDEQVAEREPIYGTPIKNDPLPEDMAAAWANPAPIEALALPKRNAFVPTDLSVKPLGDDVSPFGPRDPYTPIPGSLEDAELDGNADIAAASAADGAAAARFRSSDEAGQGPPAASAAAQQASSEAETAARALLQREQQAGFPVISAGVQPLPPGAIAAWWRQDETFRRPTINVMLEVETPRVLESAASSVLTSLYISAIDDQLQADSYRAQEAGYVYSITKSSLVSGLSIAIGGFSEKLPQWLTVVLGGLRSAELDEKRFESHRGLLLQSLDNNEKTSKPYSRALYFYKTFVGENRFNIPELKKAVQSATLAAAKQHTKQLFEAARIVMLVHGNALQQDAAAISRIVSRAFAGVKILPESQALTSRAGARWIRGNRMIQRRVANPAEGDSATAVLHQLGLREDCFAGLVPDNATTNATTAPGDGTTNATTAPGDDDNTTNTTAPASASLLQRAGRHGARRAGHKLRRQEPIGVGSPSEDLGTDGEAATRMARSMGADDNTTSTIGEAVRKRECVVRELTATLLGNALYQPAFETLRTKQQLGYLVFAGLTASPTMGASEQPSRAALASPALRRAGITVHSGLARRRGLHDHPVRAPGSAGSSLGSQAWSRSAALASAAQEAATAADALTSAPLTVRGDELQALYVMVEGPENSPALLDVRITQFLNKVNDTLEALAADPEEDGGVASSVWDSMVASQISSKLRKPMSLSEGTGTMWGEIAARTLRFQRSQEQLDVLRGGHVEMSDVVALYNSRVLDTANGAGRLSVQMFGADVPFETPMQAWEKDVKSTGRSAGQIPPECVTAVNVTDKDAINARLA
jgi:secreted Zn-dependent insulinase-like peptidase